MSIRCPLWKLRFLGPSPRRASRAGLHYMGLIFGHERRRRDRERRRRDHERRRLIPSVLAHAHFAESTQTPVSDGRFMHYMGLIFGHERRRRDQDCKSQQEATTLQKVRKRQCSVAPARPTLFHKAAGRGGISPTDCRLAPGGAWISPMRPQLPGSAKSQPFRSISLLAQSWPL